MPFPPSYKPPYFAVVLTSSLLLENMMYQVMIGKIADLAQSLPGFLGLEKNEGEHSIFITYWSDKASAETWKSHEMFNRILSLGEKFWLDQYALRLLEVLDDHFFVQESAPEHASRYPRIDTQRGVLKVLAGEQAHLLKEYVEQEKAFLAPWEPERNEAYYSLEVCQLRVSEMRRDFLEDRAVTMCFLSKDESRILGYINYSNIVRGVFDACHLGYSLRESEQGQGLMFEALTAGNQFMKKQHSIHRIQASYMPRNEKSGALLARLGFEREGMARDYLKINGQWEDHILTALVFSD